MKSFAREWLLAFALYAIVAGACHAQPPPAPPAAPDASDAAPPAGDALPPSSPCQAACTALAAAGCVQGTVPDCVTTLAHVDGSRLVRTPTGAALTCAAVAGIRTVADAKALGLPCGQP